MALKNTTFRLSEEDLSLLAELVETTGIKSGELKRRVVSLGIESIQKSLENQGEVETLGPTFSGILVQQKKMSELVERQLLQAEKAIERQKAQAESVVSRMSQQQRRLSELVEKQVSQAEKALSNQRQQVDKLLETIVSQPRRLSEQVREQFSKLPDFDWRRKGNEVEAIEAEVTTEGEETELPS